MTTDIISQVLDNRGRGVFAPAIIQGKTKYTYDQLKSKILAVGSNLREQGLEEGDRVLFSVRPNPDGIILALAIVSVGGVVVFADPGTAPDLFEARLKLTNPKFVAAESALYFASLPKVNKLISRADLNLPDYASLDVKHFYSGPKLPGVPKDAVSISSLSHYGAYMRVTGNPENEAIIVFTSGTTDDPKAVVHSRSSLGGGMSDFIERMGLDKLSYTYTDHFMFGVATLVAGGKWEIPDHSPTKNAKKWVNELYKRNVTHTFLVPAETNLILDEIKRQKREGHPTLGALVMGAAPVLPPLVKRVNNLLPETKVISVYGMTEILPIATVTGEEKLNYPDGDLAGLPINAVTVSIDSPDSNGAGEVVLRGDNLMLGYLGKEQTKEHHTGDIGRLDDDGRLVLLGRKKDMLIRGNKNIYPGLYESSIASIDGVDGAVIVGVQDTYGEDLVVLALVSKEADKKALVSKVKERLKDIMDYDAQPDVITFIDSIPLSGRSSKPNRIKLREDLSKNSEVENILKERVRA